MTEVAVAAKQIEHGPTVSIVRPSLDQRIEMSEVEEEPAAAGAPRSTRWWTIAALAPLLTAAIVVPRLHDVPRATAPTTRPAPTTSLPTPPQLAPHVDLGSGRLIVKNDGGLWALPLDGSVVRHLTNRSDVNTVVPSPDARFLYFVGGQVVLDTSTGVEISVPLSKPTGADWSPDGARLAICDSDEVRIFEPGRSTQFQQVVDSVFRLDDGCHPAWAGDGSLYYVSRDGTEVRRWEPSTGDRSVEETAADLGVAKVTGVAVQWSGSVAMAKPTTSTPISWPARSRRS